MPRVHSFEFTVKDIAERLALCTGEPPAFHARQLRHWAASGVLDALYPSHTRGDGKTAPRVFNTRHLAGCLLLHFYAVQRSDVEFLAKVASLMRNRSIAVADTRVWTPNGGGFSPVASDGLSIAMHFARKIAEGENPREWMIFFRIHLTDDGEVKGGTFLTEDGLARERSGALNFYWIEERTVNVSALLPCMFRDGEGKTNDLAAAGYLHNGIAYDPSTAEPLPGDA